jgi:energy-coupling factor transporter transmembrane protein EcfT
LQEYYQKEEQRILNEIQNIKNVEKFRYIKFDEEQPPLRKHNISELVKELLKQLWDKVPVQD